MRIAIAAGAVALALSGAAGAAPPGANVGLVFTQNLGTLEPRESAQHAYLCATQPSGASARKVTPMGGVVVDPDVSPNGTQVAFVDTQGGPSGALKRVPAEGGPAVELARNMASAWPAWSADGTEILFSSNATAQPGDFDLYSVPSGGGTPLRIVGGPRREAMPAASPDGSGIAFVRSDPSAPTASGGELWIASPDGRSTFRIVPERSDISHPSWSYEGQTLVFEAGGSIYAVEPFTENFRGPLAQGREPELSPDGTQIAFLRDGDVWTMSADGREQRNVTHSPISESGPTWQSTPVPTGGQEPCALVGTEGDDVITGSEYPDFVYDSGGNDVYRTLGGDDRIFDGPGADRYETGDGSDRVTLVAGPDTTDGGPGDDTIHGTQGPDRILGGEGNDTIYGLRGADIIYGGPGNDRIEGNRGDDSIDGGLGDDVLYGGIITGSPANYDGHDLLLGRGGNDRLAGGWQKDRLFGGPGNDRLRGGLHADHLVGEAGADDVDGEGGDDLLLGRDRTRDRLIGGPGFDRARLDAVDRRSGIERVLR